MNRFEWTLIECSFCGDRPSRGASGSCCATCGGKSFAVEIERSASGFDGDGVAEALVSGLRGGGGSVGTFLDGVMDDGGTSIYFKTHSLLRCDGVSGDELLSFGSASIDDRRRMYVSWKRRDIESHLDPNHRICKRCRVSYRVYENEWNRAGLCSKTCHRAAMKSKGRRA